MCIRDSTWAEPKKGMWQVVEERLEQAFDDEITPRLTSYFNRFVANWDHKPQFAAKKIREANRIGVHVYPAGRNARFWRYVSGGVAPRPIFPRRKRALRFQLGYRPHTKPGGFYQGPGVATGEVLVRKYVKNWPGIRARRFETIIVRWMRPWFRLSVRRAILAGMQAYMRDTPIKRVAKWVRSRMGR